MNDRPESDPYALLPEDVKDPPTRFLDAIKQIGPGLILAASIVGTGELINTTSLGAKAGYSLLWLILLSCVIKVFVQVEMGRYAITHGKTSLAAFDTLPGPRLGTSWLCWLWLFMTLATQAQIAAMEGTVGQAAHLAFPAASEAMARGVGGLVNGGYEFLHTRQEHVWATLTAFAAILLLLSGGYKRLEKVTTILVATVTLFTVASVGLLQFTKFRISVADVESGLRLTVPLAALTLALSAFGITGVGASELFAYPYWCIEKGYARSVGPRSDDEGWARRARGWIKVMQLDAWFSMIVFTVATIAFYLLGAAVLHRQGLVPKDKDMIKTLSVMYLDPLADTPLRGFKGLTTVGFLLGAWAVLFKTLYVATAANSRLTTDFLHLSGIWRQDGPRARDRTVKLFCVLYPIGSLGLYFAFREPQGLITVGGIAQSLMLPLIAGAALYLRRRDDVPSVRASVGSAVMAWVAFVAITGVAGAGLFRLLSGWVVAGK